VASVVVASAVGTAAAPAAEDMVWAPLAEDMAVAATGRRSVTCGKLTSKFLE
jgi:hypothetical protein